MALNPTVLSALIKAKRLAALGPAGVNNAAMTADCDAIAEAVIEHIAAAAIVSVNMAGGVTACPAGAGTCTGPSTGAIT